MDARIEALARDVPNSLGSPYVTSRWRWTLPIQQLEDHVHQRVGVLFRHERPHTVKAYETARGNRRLQPFRQTAVQPWLVLTPHDRRGSANQREIELLDVVGLERSRDREQVRHTVGSHVWRQIAGHEPRRHRFLARHALFQDATQQWCRT